MRLVLFSVLALSGFLCATANAVVVSDGDFTARTPFSFVTDDPFTAGPPPNISHGTTTRISSEGNPGAYLQAEHTFSAGDSISTGGIKTNLLYDPSVECPIESISVTADLLHPPGGSSAWQLVLEQG